MSYGLFLKGGSIAETAKRDGSMPLKTFENQQLARQEARRRNRNLTPGEKNYYKLRYFVKEVA